MNDDLSRVEIEKIQAEIAQALAQPTEQDALQENDAAATDALSSPVQGTPAPSAALPPPRSGITKKQSSWLRKIAVVCIVCTLGTSTFGFAYGAARVWLSQRGQDTAPPVTSETPHTTPDPVNTTQYIFQFPQETTVATLADMIDLIAPSVVGLTVFTDPDEQGRQLQSPRRSGTGVIFAEDEYRVYIVTAYYVVRQGTEVFVQFSCGALVMAQPFASEQDINIAIITVWRDVLAQAGVTEVVLASFGDSSAMRMGDTVIAMGNSRGEGVSSKRGIISTDEQTVTVPSRIGARMREVYTLQTDAAINYGDSGGPLLNARGEVVGIIDASISLFDETVQAEGIGHSISANTVAPVLYAIVNRLRPAIGIRGDTVSAARAEDLGIPQAGVWVQSVMPNGAAAAAGMVGGDVITAFNGVPILDMDQLREIISQLFPGDVVEVSVLRDGEHIVLELELFPMEFDSF